MASYVEIIRLFLSSQTLDFRKNTPAYAGNTSDPSSTIPVFRDHPRLRGEYSIPFDRRVALIGSPPLTRGIRGIDNTICYISRITPACAGNTYSRIPKWSGCRDHPRLRGEYGDIRITAFYAWGSPPLARGIPQEMEVGFTGMRITPACAGNTLRLSGR